MSWLVQHADVLDPAAGIGGIAAAVSQLSLWRNYAPRIQILDIEDQVELGQPVALTLQLEDKSSIWSGRSPWNAPQNLIHTL